MDFTKNLKRIVKEKVIDPLMYNKESLKKIQALRQEYRDMRPRLPVDMRKALDKLFEYEEKIGYWGDQDILLTEIQNLLQACRKCSDSSGASPLSGRESPPPVSAPESERLEKLANQVNQAKQILQRMTRIVYSSTGIMALKEKQRAGDGGFDAIIPEKLKEFAPLWKEYKKIEADCRQTAAAGQPFRDGELEAERQALLKAVLQNNLVEEKRKCFDELENELARAQDPIDFARST